jgi:RNA polymerase sigma-70 factor (ECF subfamily)
MDTNRSEQGALSATELAQHLDYLRRFARSRARDEDIADEAVQETMLAALESRDRFAGRAKLRTWLTGILLHKIHDAFRREARGVSADLYDPKLEESLPATYGDPEAALSGKELERTLARAMQELPPRQREAFLLKEVSEVDSEPLTRLLGVSKGNLWVLVHRARAHLQSSLEREGYSIA